MYKKIWVLPPVQHRQLALRVRLCQGEGPLQPFRDRDVSVLVQEDGLEIVRSAPEGSGIVQAHDK